MMIRRRSAGRGPGPWTAVFVLFWMLIAPPAGGVEIHTGNLIITDRSGDPFGEGDERGIIMLGDEFSTVPMKLVAAPDGFTDPVASAILRDTRLIIVDANADVIGDGQSRGCLWLVDPQENIPGSATRYASSPGWDNPIDILLEESGDLLVLDADADPLGLGTRPGALYRVEADTRVVRLIAASVFWVEPRSMVFDRDGRVLIWDSRADPFGIGRNPGALFRVDPASGIVDVVFSKAEFSTPWAVALDRAGDYLILDRDANPGGHPGAPGALYRVNRADLGVQAIVAPEDFIEPIDLVVDARGDAWVLDQRANPFNYGTAQGAVFRCNLTTGAIEKTLSSGFLRLVTGLTQFAGTALDSSRVGWEDLSGEPLQPGDRVRVSMDVRNTGSVPGDPVEMTHAIGGIWDYLTGTLQADDGSLAYDPRTRLMRWSGALAPGGSTSLTYDLRLRDNVPNHARIVERVVLSVARAGSQFDLVDTVERRASAGRYVWADYQTLGGANAGTLMEMPTGAVRPNVLFRGAPLVQPDDVAFLSDGSIMVLDRRSQPDGPEGVRGGLYKFDPLDGSIDTVLTLGDHPELRFPVGIASGGGDEIFLIDKDANPLGLPGQPGAVFRLDTATGRLRLVASSRLFSEPADAILETTGTLLLVDYDADPSGDQPRAGSLFEINPDAGTVRPIPHAENTFVDPIGLAEAPGRRILIADLNADPRHLGGNTGAIFELRRAQNNTMIVAVADSLLTDPTDVYVKPDGSLVITDREANPYNLPPRDRGAVFQYGVSTGLRLLSADGSLYGPEAIAGYDLANVNFRDLTAADVNGPPSSAGDSLSIEAIFSNSGRTPAIGAFSSVQVSDKLALIDAEGENVSWDPSAGTASWFGDVGPGDAVTFRARARIGEGLLFGDKVHATLRVSAPGASPLLDSAVVRVVAPLRTGDLVLADRNADPSHLGNGDGALFLLRSGTAKLEHVLLTDSVWTDPSAVEDYDSGRILVADDRGPDTGRIYLADYLRGTSEIYIEDERLGAPVDLVRSSSGDLFIVDPLARPVPGDPTTKPVVFRQRPGEQRLNIFSSPPDFRQPEQLVEDDDGRLWIVDRRADVNGTDAGRGALFRLDPETGAVVDTISDSRFLAPVALMNWTGEGLIMLDALATGIGGGRGAIFFADPDSGTVRIQARDARFRQLEGGTFSASGELWITDRIAKDETQPGEPRTLFRWDPETNRIDQVGASALLAVPTDMFALPGPNPRIISYESEDLNGPPFTPGDLVEIRASITNVGPMPTLSASYRDTIPGPFLLDPGTIETDTGIVQTQEQAGIVLWNLDLAPGEVHQIRYRGRVRTNLPQGVNLIYRAHLRTVEGIHRVKRVQDRLPVYFQDNYLYIVDGDSDPFRLGGKPGAIWKVNLSTGLPTAMGSSAELTQPMTTLAMPDNPPTVLVVDAASNPLEHPRARGALWRWVPETGAMALVAADSTFRSPRAAIAVNDRQVLLLDAIADPLEFGPALGPGAVYLIDVVTGKTEVFASDSTLVSPRDLLLDGRGGVWLADADADPGDYGLRNGAVYRLDLFSRQLSVFAMSADFRGPSAVTVGPDGSLFVLDRDVVLDPNSDARGAVYRVDGSGNVDLFASSAKFRRPFDLIFDQYGRLLVSDSEADPLRTGRNVGAIFRREGVVGEFQTFVSGSRFDKFGGFFLREALTPIEVTGLAAVAGEDGIEIAWEVATARFDGFFVQRAEGEGSPIEDFASLNEGSPIPGEGPYRYLDETGEPGTVYEYRIVAYVPGGGSLSFGPVSATAIAPRFALRPPAPNPASSGTLLRFGLPATGNAVIDIHDIGGRRIRRLTEGVLRAGRHEVYWDGRDDRGRGVASGLYIARLTWSGREESRRIVYIH